MSLDTDTALLGCLLITPALIIVIGFLRSLSLGGGDHGTLISFSNACLSRRLSLLRSKGLAASLAVLSKECPFGTEQSATIYTDRGRRAATRRLESGVPQYNLRRTLLTDC